MGLLEKKLMKDYSFTRKTNFFEKNGQDNEGLNENDSLGKKIYMKPKFGHFKASMKTIYFFYRSN